MLDRTAFTTITLPPLVEPNEDAIATAFAEHYAERFTYDHTHGAWLRWDDEAGVWRIDTVAYVPDCVRAFVRAVRLSHEKQPADLTRERTWRAIERAARDDRRLAVDHTVWDREPAVLGTPGRTVVQYGATAIIRTPDPRDMISKQTAIAPAAEGADYPLWRDFLDEATGGDQDLIAFLRRWCGYCCTGLTTEQTLVFIYGDGGTGKTTFANTIIGVLGDYAVTAPMDTFVAARGDRHPADLAMLAGARLVVASETQEGRAWDETRIKQLTGGEPISARFMHRNFFTYRPQFKLVVVGNFQPVLRNVDNATRRRFCIVPFLCKPRQPDPQLEEKLKVEWPAILRWMLDGRNDWARQGLARPERVLKETAAYFEAQDTLGQWLDDDCDAEPGNQYKSAPSAALYRSWKIYAEAAGDEPGSRKGFAYNLQRRGFEPYRSRGERGFKGLRLKPGADHPRSGERDDNDR